MQVNFFHSSIKHVLPLKKKKKKRKDHTLYVHRNEMPKKIKSRDIKKMNGFQRLGGRN